MTLSESIGLVYKSAGFLDDNRVTAVTVPEVDNVKMGVLGRQTNWSNARWCLYWKCPKVPGILPAMPILMFSRPVLALSVTGAESDWRLA